MSVLVTGSNVPSSPLSFLVDTQLKVEKLRIAIQVRQSHLERNDRDDIDTDKVLEHLKNAEAYIDGRIAEDIENHPAFKWFDCVKGVGRENIGKLVGPIDIRKANTVSGLWKFAGMHVVEREISPEEQMEEIRVSATALKAKFESLEKKLAKKTKKSGEEEKNQPVLTLDMIGELVDNLSAKADETLAPVKRGYAPRRTPGKKMEYNSELRVMCFRLAGSLLKAGGKFADYYANEKAKLRSRYLSRGIKVIPALELPTKNGKIFEPVGTISAMHLHMQAQRKMIKLFLSLLWHVWREAEGLPTRNPYVLEHFPEHTHLISPWDMVDRDAPRYSKKKR